MSLSEMDGTTLLEPSEAEGLKLPHITNREQLNLWEQKNIWDAEVKFFSRKHRDVLTENFLLRLHKQMFGKVWKWAGKYRTSEKISECLIGR